MKNLKEIEEEETLRCKIASLIVENAGLFRQKEELDRKLSLLRAKNMELEEHIAAQRQEIEELS